MNWPKVSIVVLVYNGGEGVEKALKSILKQDYPKNKLEIIVSDNNSSDDSVKRAKKYVKKVFICKTLGYRHRAIAMRKATGDFIYMIMEQDMEIKSKDFVKKLILPLVHDPKLAGSFTREYPNKNQAWVTRFISYDPVQRDPLFQFLTPSIESTIVEDKKDYFVCDYNLDRIPPTTHMFFRKSFLVKSGVWKQNEDFDHDTVLKLIKNGFSRFAYVPSAGMYHNHANSLEQLVNKKIRNLNSHYFPQSESLSYTWMGKNKKYEVLRLCLWVLYANLFIPATLRGIFKFMKYKDLVLLMEPIVTIVVTDRILFEFLLNTKGRKIVGSWMGL